MSNLDEVMKYFDVITNTVVNSNYNNFHRLKVIKYRAEVQKLKQECCHLRLAKSASTDKVRESQENEIRLLNNSKTINSGNIELENKLLLLKKENELMEISIENDSIEYENECNEIEKKFPHYWELKVKRNEIEQLKNSINNLELKAVSLRGEKSKEKAQISKTNSDYIKLAEFMVAPKKKYEETVTSNKRVYYNDSLYKSETVDNNELFMPATSDKFEENVKKVLIKDCTEVDEKDLIDEIIADIDSKKKRPLEIFEGNDESETAFNYDNIAKRKRSLNDLYDDDKEINEESSPKKQDCSKKQVIEIIEDVKVDQKLSGVNVKDLKETNKIIENVQANTFSADADNSDEGEEQIEELDMTLLSPTQYKDFSEDESPKIVSFNVAADKPTTEVEEEIEEVKVKCTQSEMDLSIDSATNEFYTLDEPIIIYVPETLLNLSLQKLNSHGTRQV